MMAYDDTAYPARLTLPDWPTDVPPLPRAAAWTLLRAGCSGAAGCAIPLWHSQTPAEVLDDTVGAELFTDRLVGWRLAICGEASRVAHAKARATAAGLLSEEIVVFVERTESHRWYCPSCGATTLLPAHEHRGSCSGCGRLLHLHRHWSRTSGRYLADAHE